jgi:hypothetical protein
VLILWPLVVEGLIGGLLFAANAEGLRKWLPYQAGIALGNPNEAGGNPTLGRLAGGLYFFAVTSAVAGIGAWLTNRRDA